MLLIELYLGLNSNRTFAILPSTEQKFSVERRQASLRFDWDPDWSLFFNIVNQQIFKYINQFYISLYRGNIHQIQTRCQRIFSKFIVNCRKKSVNTFLNSKFICRLRLQIIYLKIEYHQSIVFPTNIRWKYKRFHKIVNRNINNYSLTMYHPLCKSSLWNDCCLFGLVGILIGHCF